MLSDGQSLKDRIKLRAIANQAAGHIEASCSGNIIAINSNLAIGRNLFTSETLESSSLARARDTQESKALAIFESEARLLNSLNISIALLNLIDHYS